MFGTYTPWGWYEAIYGDRYPSSTDLWMCLLQEYVFRSMLLSNVRIRPRDVIYALLGRRVWR